jgi:hypothetical protein
MTLVVMIKKLINILLKPGQICRYLEIELTPYILSRTLPLR